MNQDTKNRIQRRVYKLSSPSLPNMVYYGSTSQTINVRLSKHLSSYRRWKDGKPKFCASFSIFDACNDYVMEELLVVDDCTKREIEARENTYIISNPCLNRKKAYKTAEEKRKENRKYWDANREAYNQSVKRCWEKNRDKYLENMRKAKQLKRQARQAQQTQQAQQTI